MAFFCLDRAPPLVFLTAGKNHHCRSSSNRCGLLSASRYLAPLRPPKGPPRPLGRSFKITQMSPRWTRDSHEIIPSATTQPKGGRETKSEEVMEPEVTQRPPTTGPEGGRGGLGSPQRPPTTKPEGGCGERGSPYGPLCEPS